MPDPPLSPLARLQRWLRSLPPARGTGDTIAGQVGEGARGVVIGKNVIQIERFVFPLWLIGLFFLVLLVVALLLWLRLVPAQMPDDTFNVAVATFGEQEADGQIRSSARGEWFGQRTYDVLAAFREENGVRGEVTLWHDSMGWAEKRRDIGLVTAENAATLTERLNAHILVYGHVTASGDLAMNFYADPELQSLTDALIVGSYEFGDPIPFGPDFDPRSTQRNERLATSLLQPRVVSLAELLRGFVDYSVGAVSAALEIWERAAQSTLALGAPSEGEEVLRLLIGVGYLTPQIRGDSIRYDLERVTRAETAFTAARNSPALSVQVRAWIGLGNVHLVRAQELLGSGNPPPPEGVQQAQQELQQALAEFERAVALARQVTPPAPLLETLASIARAPADRLQGEAHLLSGERALAAQALDRAIQNVRANLPPLIEANEYRFVAQGYQLEGTALFQQAWVAGQQGRPQVSRDLYQQAVAAFDACAAQSDLDNDQFLQLIAASCGPPRATAEAWVTQPEGGAQ